jgi:hypothetical protein
MNATNVLKIYELVMMEYDKLLPLVLAPVVDNNLEQTQNQLHTLATETAPNCASGESAGFGEATADPKIMVASLAAFNIASTHTENVQDCTQYKEDFRKAYDAALRVELYRQFLTKGQDIKELTLEFLKEKPNDTPTLKSLMDFLFEDISKNIHSEFRKFEKAQGSLTQVESQLIDSMRNKLNDLLEKFKQSISVHLSTPDSDKIKTNSIQKAALDFQIAAGQLIRSYQLKTESNEKWAPFLKNMLMLITGIGTIPAIISLVNKAITGKYAFFDKVVVSKTSPEEVSPEDQLLGKPPTN